MTGIVFDVHEINQLAADLGDAPAEAGVRIVQAFEVTSTKVKKAWAGKLEGTPDVPHAPRSITYDIKSDGKSIESEIGAERGRLQAPIVTVIEFGAPGNNTPPHGYGAGALQENQDDFVHGLELAIGDPLK